MTTYTIYTLTNKRTGKLYVGRTKNPHTRFANHKCALRKGNHHNFAMQDDYDAGDQFDYKHIEMVEGLEESKQAERKWVNSFPEVYNLLSRKNCVRDAYNEQYRNRLYHALRKPCTLDGIVIYPSVRALKKAVGSSARYYPQFQFVAK